MKNIKNLYPHLLALLGFVIVSLVYFYPVMQGKKISQSDISQYVGMAKEQNDFRAQTGEEPYWTNSAFGGMPTYQLGAKYPHNYIKQLDEVIRFLPRPADYLFLYFIGFYILMRALRLDVLKSFLGALIFGFSTYLIIILGAGHNAKAHAIAYMPMVVAGVLMVYQKRYVLGGLLTLFAVALEINANHFQMTFYLLLLLLIISIYYAYLYIKHKDFAALGKAAAVFVITGILAVGANATNLLATSEYAKYSTRSDSDLTFEPDGKPKLHTGAMSYEYITEYSYGIAESLNLIAPRVFGGSNVEKASKGSPVYEFIIGQGASPQEAAAFCENVATYWGDQPIVAAPAYIGAGVFFLFVLALFMDKRKIKNAFLAGALVSLMLSWGKNFPALTNFFIDFVPMYNKFRAVSSIQVILELCIPVLAMMGMQSFFNATATERISAIKKTALVCGGFVVVLFLGYLSFDYVAASDDYFMQAYGEMGVPFVEALRAQRQHMYFTDLIRTLVLFLAVCGVLFAFAKAKLSELTAVVLLGVILVGDLVAVDKNYVNKDSFVAASKVDIPFEKNAADEFIQRDTTNFRVFELNGSINSARASYFHKSIGGYHAAKPKKLQQLFDYQINNQNMQIINMLNVKYIIQQDEEGQFIPLLNDKANGNAWMIKQVKKVNSADEEMKALTSFDSKKEMIINATTFPDVAKKLAENYSIDSTSFVKLTQYKPNHLVYAYQNSKPTVVVFSEMYYANGWNAYVDGQLTPHFEADYTLRAMQVPGGAHKIEFKFEPEVIQKGGLISLFSCIGILGLILIAAVAQWKQCKTKK